MIAKFSDVLVHAKDSCTIIMVGCRNVVVFDRAGRILYAVREGRPLRAGLDGRLRPEGDASEIYEEVGRLEAKAPVEVRELLASIAVDGARAWAESPARFRQVYGSVPVLPPDQYGAVYLQATMGCAWNRCSFCTLHRGRPFQVRKAGEFSEHVREVLAFLGPDLRRRKSVFLGDANAMGLPMPILEPILEEVGSALPTLEIHAFADARFHENKDRDDVRRLCDLGVRRITFGLETGSPKLYRMLRKPGTIADLLHSVLLARRGGLSVGITVLVGAGGREWAEDHLSDTTYALRRAKLGPGDFVYLSPVAADPESDYATWAGEDPTRNHADDSFESKLRGSLADSGARVVPYQLSKFAYR